MFDKKRQMEEVDMNLNDIWGEEQSDASMQHILKVSESE
jgi:hypothetical protein